MPAFLTRLSQQNANLEIGIANLKALSEVSVAPLSFPNVRFKFAH
jgi:hypothetical protein